MLLKTKETSAMSAPCPKAFGRRAKVRSPRFTSNASRLRREEQQEILTFQAGMLLKTQKTCTITLATAMVRIGEPTGASEQHSEVVWKRWMPTGTGFQDLLSMGRVE
jgi:hypothetical protein